MKLRKFSELVEELYRRSPGSRARVAAKRAEWSRYGDFVKGSKQPPNPPAPPKGQVKPPLPPRNRITP
jgi:hypothetical protein